MTSLQIKPEAVRQPPQVVLERQRAATRRKRGFYLALFAVALVASSAGSGWQVPAAVGIAYR